MSKDKSKLTKKVITNKKGHRQSVWVKPAGQDTLSATKEINKLKEQRNKLPSGHKDRATIQSKIDKLTDNTNKDLHPSKETKAKLDDKNKKTDLVKLRKERDTLKKEIWGKGGQLDKIKEHIRGVKFNRPKDGPNGWNDKIKEDKANQTKLKKELDTLTGKYNDVLKKIVLEMDCRQTICFSSWPELET